MIWFAIVLVTVVSAAILWAPDDDAQMRLTDRQLEQLRAREAVKRGRR